MHRRARAHRVGTWLCVAGATLGAVGLLDGVTGTTIWSTFLPDQPVMQPNTGLGLLLIGTAAALRASSVLGRARRALSTSAALLALALGIGTLAEYALGIDLGIDHPLEGPFIFRFPGRPAPLTALGLTLLAVGVLLIDVRPWRRARPSEWLALAAWLIGFTALLGFTFGAAPLYRLAHTPLIGVAPPTAVGLLLISSGLLLQRTTAGLMRVAMASGPGGVLLRRLAPATILGPGLLGLTTLHGLRALGVESSAVLAACLAAALTVAGLLLLAVTAAPLNRVHDALESSRAQARSAIEQAPDGIFLADLAGRYTDVNDAGCRMLGLSREEILGKRIHDLIPPDRGDQLAREKEQLMEGGEVVSEWVLRKKDGAWLPVEVSARILPDGRWQGLVRDISERKRLEEDQRLLAKAGAILSSTLDLEVTLTSIGRLATESLADFCVVYLVEPRGEIGRLTAVGHEPGHEWICDALKQMPLDRSRAPEIWSELDANRSVLMDDLTPATIEAFAQDEAHLRVLRAMAPRSVIVTPLSARGKLVGAMALVSSSPGRTYSAHDVQLAEQLAQRAAHAIDNAQLYANARRASEIRDSVIGVVAHDLRSPLGAIVLQAALLRRADREPDRRSVRPAESIERSARRMNRIIEDLLDVTRMEEGHLPIERTRVPVRKLLCEARDAHMPHAVNASLQLVLDAPPDLPDVWADPHRLLQILENLIGNAVKFTETGGAITIGAAPKDDSVLFWVADTGVGVSAEHLPRLFDRFWQVRRGRHGLGLGLPIVKGLVEAQGGRIWVESTLGRGTTFYFTLPALRRVEAWAPDPAVPAA